MKRHPSQECETVPVAHAVRNAIARAGRNVIAPGTLASGPDVLNGYGSWGSGVLPRTRAGRAFVAAPVDWSRLEEKDDPDNDQQNADPASQRDSLPEEHPSD